MSKTPTTSPNDLRALIAEALHAYELARATHLKNVAIASAEQERSGHLLASIQQVEEAARDLLEKAGFAHIAGAPLSLDGTVAPVRRADESVAAAFTAAQLAAADLRTGVLLLAHNFIDTGHWEEARRVLQPLLTDNKSTGNIPELQYLLCEAHYQLGMKAVKTKNWSSVADHFRAIRKIALDYKDVKGWLQQYLLGHTDCIGIFQHAAPVKSVAFSPDGQMLASASFYKLTLWDVTDRTGKYSVSSPKHAYDPGLITRIDFLNPTLIQGAYRPGVEYSFNYSFSFDIRSQQFTTDSSSVELLNRRLFFGVDSILPIQYVRGEPKLTVRDEKGKEIVALVHTGGINDIAVSPDGTLLATAGEDGAVRLWGPKT